MTSSRTAPDPAGQLLRAPLALTGLVGVAVAVAATLWQGTPGLIGAVAGLTVTVAFFTVSLLLMRWTARLNPEMVMAVAVTAYGTKVGLLLVLLVALYDLPGFSGPAFAAAIILCTTSWLAGQLYAFRKGRFAVFDEHRDGDAA